MISCGPQKKYVEYKVKTGETLRSIAKDNDLNLRDILNKVKPNTIAQVAKLPGFNPTSTLLLLRYLKIISLFSEVLLLKYAK